MNPPMTDAMTMMAPMMTIMILEGGALGGDGVVFGQERFDREDGRCVNLADARFGHPEDLGDFAQAQILKIIKSQDLALHFGQGLKAFGDDASQFAPFGGAAGI